MIRAILLILVLSFQINAQYDKKMIDKIGEQLLNEIEIFGNEFPEYTVKGKWLLRAEVNWFAGFPGGSLWQIFHITGDSTYYNLALKEADKLIPYQNLDNTHDLGFIFIPTCVEAYKVSGIEKYRDVSIQAARMLLKRFNKNGKFIRAWGKLGTPKKAGLMIIDTMMNLELLFWAYQQTNDIEFYNIAVQHAETTMKDIVREDYSSYHVIEFDIETGEVLKKRTKQGFSDTSTWACGQAWGIYGFAKTYFYTHDERYLDVSKKMAKYFIAHLPKDHVPYWDLTLSGNDVVRDASAGAIAASGMYILSSIIEDKKDKNYFSSLAEKIVSSLNDSYLFTDSKRGVEEGILLHTVYNHNADKGVDESYPCGDFYYIEALRKYGQSQ